MPIDLEFLHPTDIYALRPCRNPDATDLIAIGGEHSVEVILVSDTACRRIACFHVGSRITTLAWSSKTTSPTSTEKWTLELVAATSDFGLHLLTKSSTSSEYIFPFGGGLSGHHGRVNDMVFCGGWDEDSSRYVATVSDDKMLMVWDLHPVVDPTQGSRTPSPALELDISMSPPMSSRPQPTAYVIPFPHPLTTIRNHPATSKEFIVADARGSIFLVDWRSDPEEEASAAELRHSSVIELVEPVKLAGEIMGGNRDAQGKWSACVDWRVDSMDVVGGVFGQKFAIWDISKLRGGLPHITGPSFSEGGRIFRWCPTHPDYFAISSQSPTKGAIVHVHNYSYVHAPPTVFTLRPKPHFVRDFDFLAAGNIPRLVIAVGRILIVFPIGEEP
ncbi:hypothetical protein JR316_0003290 [Psilocybe cubensis]|uniref:Uncharacterized protein n=2 Tax=Psilocybe cubensis TaxID=181762 RepID=A0A8H8CMZ4_PSICU|nr:hypothetical protein JR316_0003290 [Psilocybe cubensis]KAH9483812.1 hypothetical protein JR316_0003290 [Psilocybe cubensis]